MWELCVWSSQWVLFLLKKQANLHQGCGAAGGGAYFAFRTIPQFKLLSLPNLLTVEGKNSWAYGAVHSILGKGYLDQSNSPLQTALIQTALHR